jgi:hypothetical protein
MKSKTKSAGTTRSSGRSMKSGAAAVKGGAMTAAAAKPPRAARSAGSTARSMQDKLEIRELIENWVLYRDSGDWERFKTVWHEDGYMMATWFQGTFNQFIDMNKAGWEKGVSILHFLGGTTIDIAGNRAIAQTKMNISQRAPVHDVTCDVNCVGRFYDFFEKRKGKWGLVLRRLFYEKDRMDPVDPSQMLRLDQALLSTFPVGYRHLAYLQSNIGYKVKTDMPGLRGPQADMLYGLGKRWLAGEKMDDSFKR